MLHHCLGIGSHDRLHTLTKKDQGQWTNGKPLDLAVYAGEDKQPLLGIVLKGKLIGLGLAVIGGHGLVFPSVFFEVEPSFSLKTYAAKG